MVFAKDKNMKNDPLKHILQKHILPMFTGSELTEEPETAQKYTLRRVFCRNVSEMIVRAAEGSKNRFVIRRSQPFVPADARFVECFVEHLHKVGDKISQDFIEDLINPILRRSVAERVMPKTKTDRQGMVLKRVPSISYLIGKIIGQFEAWADQTYEGRKIAAAIGIDASVTIGSGVKIVEVFDKQFGVVLANGLETFLKVDSEGDVFGHEAMNNTSTNSNLFAPLRFCNLAEWSSEFRVGIGLNRNGEILIFAGQSLVFAKRRGIWHQFTHDAVVKRMSLVNTFPPAICRAVLQTCLDVSFAKTGGGIALIKRLELDNLKAAKTVSEKDFVGAGNVKGKCLETIIANRPFNKIDRHLRQDIAAIDGATILDYRGNVFAAGAIVQLKGAGSEDGGARKAAAKTLAQYGLAIKISSDGAISGYKKAGPDNGGESKADEVFTIG